MKHFHALFTKQYNLHIVSLFFVLLLQTGCTLAPEYKQPAAPISTNWPELPKIELDLVRGTAELSKQNAERLLRLSKLLQTWVGRSSFATLDCVH